MFTQAKAEKKRKLEEDAMHKAIEAETTYKACVIECNNRQHDLDKVKVRNYKPPPFPYTYPLSMPLVGLPLAMPSRSWT